MAIIFIKGSFAVWPWIHTQLERSFWRLAGVLHQRLPRHNRSSTHVNRDLVERRLQFFQFPVGSFLASPIVVPAARRQLDHLFILQFSRHRRDKEIWAEQEFAVIVEKF